MNVNPVGLHVSASISTGAGTTATIGRQDLTIGRIFFSVISGAAALMTALGFLATGHPLLLVSSIILAAMTIILLPIERSHFRHRPRVDYVDYTESYRAPSHVSKVIPFPIVIDEPIIRPRRSHSEKVVQYQATQEFISPPEVFVHHPAPPEYIAPVVHQQRAPVGARVRDVYHHNAPSAPPVYSPPPATSWHSAPSYAPPIPQAQDPRIVGSGATARARVGRGGD